MDYKCRDIPMRLDIKYQPLNFDIYLSQVIDIPSTSLDELPYNFQLEIEALKIVDNIIERTQKKQEEPITTNEEPTNPIALLEEQVPETVQLSHQLVLPTISTINNLSEISSSQSTQQSNHKTSTQPNSVIRTLPSCPPDDTPLTPIKAPMTTPMVPQCNMINGHAQDSKDSNESQTVNRINLKDFEDIHYNPFDQIELQTIDELKELDLVFQASYANNYNTNGGTQLPPASSESSTTTSIHPPNSSQASRNVN